MPDQIFKEIRDLLRKDRDADRLTGIQAIDHMVRDSQLFLPGRFGGADIKATIDLHGIN